MIGWVKLPACPPFFAAGAAIQPQSAKKSGLVLWQAESRKRIGPEIPDAIHPERCISGVERLAQSIEFHRAVVGRNDTRFDAALEPAECCGELVAFEEEVAGARIDKTIAVGLERHNVVRPLVGSVQDTVLGLGFVGYPLGD